MTPESLTERRIGGLARSQLPPLFGRLRELVHATDPPPVIMLARRLGAVYELLLRQGMPGLAPAAVWSDRVLDTTPSPLLGREVILVDDLIVSGSTLRTNVERARALAGPRGRVRTLVAYMDRERVDPMLLMDVDELAEFSPILCSSAVLDQFALDLATELYGARGPTASDPLATQGVAVTWAQLHRLLESPRWASVDLTASVDNGTRIYSLFPLAGTDAALRRRASPGPLRLLDSFRVRLFCTVVSDEVASVRVLPVCDLVPASPSEITAVLAEVALVEPWGVVAGWRAWDPTFGAVVLRAYLASCVLTELWADLMQVAPVRALRRDLLDRIALQPFVGPGEDDIGALFDSASAHYRRGRDRPTPVPRPGHDETGGRVPPALHALVARSRGSRRVTPRRSHEPGRVAVLDPHLVVAGISLFMELWQIEEEEVSGASDVPLGLELPLLRQALEGARPVGDPVSDMALFLDVANDLGVVVPRIEYDPTHQVVFRQYRPGENARSEAIGDLFDVRSPPADGPDVSSIGPGAPPSCFLSHSGLDGSLASRLVSDLTGRGLPVWFDANDLLAGDHLDATIFDAIRSCDHLLLACSESSLRRENWSWIDRELGVALEKERSHRRRTGSALRCVIPLDLDGFLASDRCDYPRRQDLRDRFAAPFVGWESSPAAYAAGLAALVKALRAERRVV